MFTGVLNISMLEKAQNKDIVEFKLIQLRDYGLGKRHQVDDTPYGGGDGMLLKPEPIFKAIEKAKEYKPNSKVILLTPRGKRWQQSIAKEWSSDSNDYIFLCAHYEGYDERILALVDEQIRIGDFILTGGEIPTMVVIDSIVRLIPGVLGGENSAEIESFSEGNNLEFPQYTRPEEFNGVKVPDILLSGNHGAVDKWRCDHSGKVND